MDWRGITLPAGGKLIKVHRFHFMHKGVNYVLEVDEYHDGHCSGHGESATDQNYVIESVNGKTIAECLELLVQKIDERS